MGIYSRDYYRDEPPRGGGFGGSSMLGLTDVVKWLIIVNVAVFVLQLVFTVPGPGGLFRISLLDEWFALDPNVTIFGGQVWRIVTYAFLHDTSSLWHLLFNMLGLWFFGRELEQIYGSREFLWFYLVSAVTAGGMYLFFSLYFRDATPAIGASGAVMGVLMLFACHFPHQRVYFFGIFPVPIWLLVTIIVAGDMYPVLQRISNQNFSDGVAHAAHLGGLLYGYLYYQNHWRLDSWVSWIEEKFSRRDRFGRQPRAKSKSILKFPEPRSVRTSPKESTFKVFSGDSEDDLASTTATKTSLRLEERVDEILRKISQHGESSLTEEEREVMHQAAEEYKRKKKP